MSDTEIGNSQPIDDESNYGYGVSYIADKPEKIELGQKIDGINALDKQVGGNHYKKCKIQPVQYIYANGLDYFQGNIVKYITRFRDKGGKADLEKIKHYCDLLIELEYSDKAE